MKSKNILWPDLTSSHQSWAWGESSLGTRPGTWVAMVGGVAGRSEVSHLPAGWVVAEKSVHGWRRIYRELVQLGC